ncbi:MAG: hypothetical protein K6G26_11515 [Lachnospiraceae bacterium]|nr:hypothetical protein [Lachnospiraceae bacterium]
MEKTKLGITVGALGAITCFSGLFAGYLVTIVLAGYVLLFEEDAWLKRTCVKAVATLAFFSVILELIGLVPEAFSFLYDVASVFDGVVSFGKLNQIISVLTSAIGIIKTIVFLALGFKALKKQTVIIPAVDTLVSKIMD